MKPILKNIILEAGALSAAGLLAIALISMAFFGRAPQPVQAAQLNALAVTPQPTVQPGSQYANPNQAAPWQRRGMMGGMMGGWRNGWNSPAPGGWGCGGWNGGGTPAAPQQGYCWGCGGYGRGMMNGWGYNGGQYPVIPQATPDANVSFQSDVLPIFREDCTACHGATAGLSLDSYANVMKGGRSGAVIVPGDSNNSRLIQYVVRGYMPFNGQPLSAAEIQTLINWVAAGARDN